jgi:hypothetical protein
VSPLLAYPKPHGSLNHIILVADAPPAGYLFTGLSFFSWVCWIKPDNIVVNQLFGVNYGLAMGMVTFGASL